jgi:hypothetical protein
MADLDTQEKQLITDIRAYFQDSYGMTLSDEQILEIKQSLYHLGKALLLWEIQKSYGVKIRN